ncbi:putative serine esterase [Colletotrichum aenigma]|uniref:putative serine esterase n=1 Tax=Colletotrichum aenigma TaxID=1215731 RepID=UPI0018721AE4|nr:putative serine esterase [Colletotrichum aenigma]KAF5507921.1 putative serine esterase [Colletotrichum aenigma]
MNQDQFEKELAHQLEIKDQALRLTRCKNGISIDSEKASFPGFRQQKRDFKAGQQVEPGALLLSSDLVMHESVPMQVDDGTTLYSDIFLPASFQDLDSRYADPVPARVAWSPYGKQKGTTLLDDFPFRAGVPKEHLSGLQKWEGPDPDFWCPRNYAVINVDTRGAYASEGDLLIMGHQEAQDGASFITWVSKQPWCNGKVALTGNSWLAIAQWRIGSMRPPRLAALAPWEGFSDFYRHHMFSGGILFPGFHESISNTLATQGKLEDITSHGREHQLYDAYWEDKITHPERINVPVYAAASWTNPVHTPGTFEAWETVPDTVPKWLRVHNCQEWPDYYEDCNQKDLLRFFDRYLKDQKNDWETTPKVRLSVLHFGLVNQKDTVGRPEADFPLARTHYTKLFLQGDNTLSLNPDASESALPYDSQSGKQTFVYQFDKACETTGYFCAHLVMSRPEHTDMDVFVQVEKLSALKNPQAVQTIRPQNVVLQRLLKFMHDWDILPGGAGMAFHRGPSGCLRGSFALNRDEQCSKVYKPHYTFTEKVSLKKGERRALDIQMSPSGMFWEVACIIDALPQSPCSGLNQTCLCADPVFNEEVSACVKQGCTVSEALNVANMTWADCGFPLTDNTAIPRYLTGFLFILPVTFISIRLLNKAISPSLWGADDACALAGFACATAMIPIVYRLLALGLGRDIWTLQPYKITEFLKV